MVRVVRSVAGAVVLPTEHLDDDMLTNEWMWHQQKLLASLWSSNIQRQRSTRWPV